MLNEADSFADKTERHRRIVTTRAAERHNEYIQECVDRGIDLSVEDGVAIWQGCVNAAEQEWRSGIIRPKGLTDMRVLPR